MEEGLVSSPFAERAGASSFNGVAHALVNNALLTFMQGTLFNSVGHTQNECHESRVGFMGKNKISAGWWCCRPLIPALRRQRHEDHCESEASLVYKASFRTARIIQRNPVSKTNNPPPTKNKRKKKISVGGERVTGVWECLKL